MCYLIQLVTTQSSILSIKLPLLSSKHNRNKTKVEIRSERLAERIWNPTLAVCLKWSTKIARIVGNLRNIDNCKVSSIKQLKTRMQICNTLKLMCTKWTHWKFHMVILNKKPSVLTMEVAWVTYRAENSKSAKWHNRNSTPHNSIPASQIKAIPSLAQAVKDRSSVVV